MPKKTITSEVAPAAVGPYSHAVRVGGMLFASGQIPIDPEAGKVVDDSIEEQARQVFKNIAGVLASAGMGMTNIVKTTCFLTDLKNFAAVNKVYSEVFTEEFPARSCVEVSALPLGVKIEIEVIAAD